MKRSKIFWLTVLAAGLFAIVQPVLSRSPANNIVFQASTFRALSEGVYDGDTSLPALKQVGDFGLGTFNQLDGELIGLNGHFYQVTVDGITHPVNDSMQTPFATVTFFKPDHSWFLNDAASYEQLQRSIDQSLSTKNLPTAIRITGTFQALKVRSVPKQQPPFPKLSEAIKHQSIFELHNVRARWLGFACRSICRASTYPDIISTF